MNEFNDGSVAFLEDDDIDQQGHLRIGDTEKNVMVMIMGDFCGYCTKAAPVYHEFALKHGNDAFMTAVLIDGEETEKKLGQRLRHLIPNYQGVPMFVLFKDGKYTATHDGPRTVEGLESFLKQNIAP